MRFHDLTLVLQIVTALIAAWFTVVALAIWIVNVIESRRRPGRTARALGNLGSLFLVWLIVEGYVAALAKWFTVVNSLNFSSLLTLLVALTPVLNLFYAWSWFIEIMRFNGEFAAALFGLPG